MREAEAAKRSGGRFPRDTKGELLSPSLDNLALGFSRSQFFFTSTSSIMSTPSFWLAVCAVIPGIDEGWCATRTQSVR